MMHLGEKLGFVRKKKRSVHLDSTLFNASIIPFLRHSWPRDCTLSGLHMNKSFKVILVLFWLRPNIHQAHFVPKYTESKDKLLRHVKDENDILHY